MPNPPTPHRVVAEAAQWLRAAEQQALAASLMLGGARRTRASQLADQIIVARRTACMLADVLAEPVIVDDEVEPVGDILGRTLAELRAAHATEAADR